MTTPATPAQLTPEQVRALLEGITEGRWYAYTKWNGDVDLHVSTPADEEADTATVLFIACANTAADAALAAAAPALARAYLDLHAQAEAQAVRLAGKAGALVEAVERVEPALAEMEGIDAGLNGCVATHNPYAFKPDCTEQRDAWERGNARVRRFRDDAYLQGAEAARAYGALAPAEAPK